MKKFISKKSRAFIIREPKKTDIKKLASFFNKLVQEDTYILRYKENKVTIAGEKNWLAEILDKISKNESAFLQAYFENRLVGQVEVRKGPFRKRFTGTLHLAVDKDFRKEGIGEKLMSEVEKEAKAIGVKLIQLEVFGVNDPALNLYKKMGYVEFGRLPKSIDHRARMLDEIYMYKRLDKKLGLSNKETACQCC